MACMIRLRLSACLIVLLSASLILVGNAQAVASRADKRVLAGHTFMPSDILQQPFTTRDYSMRTGIGLSKVDLGATGDLDLASFGMETAVQQPFNDRLGARFSLLGGVLTGIDSAAALSFGAQGQWGLGGGLFLNFLDTERFSLTAAADASGGQTYAIRPIDAINAAIASGTLSTSGLLTKTSSFSLRPGASGAMGLTKELGLFIDTAYRMDYTDPNVGASDSSHYFEVGVGLSLNLAPHGFPVGFTTAFQRDQELGGDDSATNAFEFGLYYAPNDHFVFGVAAEGHLTDLGGGADLTTWSGVLGLTYYQ